MCGWRILSLFLVLGLAIPVLAASEEDDLEHNQRVLQKWKQDPEHYARLLADLKAFHELPRARQEQLRQFDSDFAALNTSQQRRLWEVLERYNYWLEHLPETERQRIQAITDPTERLAMVRQIREQEWQDRLPARTRADLKAALAKAPTTEEQAKILAQFKKQESERHRRVLDLAKQNPPAGPLRPARMNELPGDLKVYVERQLKPQLNKSEQEALEQADGKYPQLLQTIHKLSEAHPVLLPHPKAHIVNYQTLPQEYKKVLTLQEVNSLGSRAADQNHSWPAFALSVNQYARKKLPKDYAALPTLGAAQLGDFPPWLEKWIRTELISKLKPEEQKALKAEEKKWPEYQVKLHKLARDHKILLPQPLGLHGPRDMWEAALGASN